MKKILSLILISLSSFAYAQEAQVAENPEIEFKPSVFLMKSEIDSIFRMPKSGYFIVNADVAFKGEAFRCLPIIFGAVKEDGAPFKLECNMYITNVDITDRISERKKLLDNYLLEGNLAAVDDALFFPENMFLTFSPTDEFGKHKVEFEIKNLLTGEVTQGENFVSLIDWKIPEMEPSAEDINRFLFSFNTNFDFVGFYLAMTSPHLNLYKKGGFKGFDGITMFFCKNLFAKHKFLLDKFYESFPNMSTIARRNFIMINSFMGKSFKPEELSSEELILQNYMQKEFDFSLSPYDSEFLNDFEIEALWGEFFAIANYAPIEKILKSIGSKADADYAKGVFADKIEAAKSDVERISLQKGRLYLLVENYLNAYINSPILYRFLLWTIEHSENKDLNELLDSVLKRAQAQQAQGQEAQVEAKN